MIIKATHVYSVHWYARLYVATYGSFAALISDIIALQEKLLEPQYSSQKPGNDFLQSFAVVIGNRWPSLASLLSLSPSDIEQIKREKERVFQAKQALHMLREWNSRENASYGQLLESLKTVPLFRC